MDMTTSRTLRLLVVSARDVWVGNAGCPRGFAAAADRTQRWLPEFALRRAPPRPTVQREVRTEVTAESGPGWPAERSAQLADLDQVWRLTRGAGHGSRSSTPALRAIDGCPLWLPW